MRDGYDNMILRSGALRQYILETSVYPREHEQLKELRKATAENCDEYSRLMQLEAEAGILISMVLKIMKAKKTIEIGVFTGYSLLTTALALPEDGQITAIDKNLDAFEIGLPYIRKAGVEHKIDFVHSDALEALEEMGKKHESEFDFAFVDADKLSYSKYHELLMKVVKVGGIIAYDNTLWFGSVALEDDEVPEDLKAEQRAIKEHNRHLASDTRIEISQIPIGDGFTLCRRIA